MIYEVPYKTLIRAKPLRIMFDKVNEFTRDYYRTKYLVLFDLEKNNAIYDRFRYLVELKSGVTFVFPCNSGKTKIDSGHDFPLEKNVVFP